MLQNATPLRKSAPGPPNSSDEHVSCLSCACHGKCIFADPLQMSHACHGFSKCHKTLTFCSLLTRCIIPCACHAKTTSERPKVLRTHQFFALLASKCASRHNAVHFSDITTSKSGPSMVCFVHFDFEMCFAPQPREFFPHRNFYKCSEPGVFCTFWLGNVLRATTTFTFSTSQLLKALRSWGVLYLLTSKCASRHNGVHFFISHLARWLRTRRFSEPTFRPSGDTFRKPGSSFFWGFFFFDLLSSSLLFSSLLFSSLLWLPISAFHLSILSEVWLLNFPAKIYPRLHRYIFRNTPAYIRLVAVSKEIDSVNLRLCICT